jgi:hypothetical protein
MVPIAWNPLRFHIVGPFPKAEQVSAGDYLKHSMLLILGLRLEPRRKGEHFVISAHSSRPHLGWAKSSEPYDLAE